MMLLDIHEPGQTPLPHDGAATVGIDLGTTHSLVAISNEGHHEIILDEGGQALLPSVVRYFMDGRVMVGMPADSNTKAGEAITLHSVKRLMGRGANDLTESERENLPCRLHAESNDSLICLDIFGKAVTPIEVSSEILKALKKRAEIALGNEVKRAVITVPAYFDDAARTATKDAAALAGLEVLRLVNEPTAAALAYGLDNAKEGLYAVYDLGGGTFDVSLLNMEKGVFQVRATGGDTQLGGDDMDAALLQFLPSGIDLRQAQRVKEALTDVDTVQGVARAEFEQAIEALVRQTTDIFQDVLFEAKVSVNDLNGVILVGGSTRVPLVRKSVAQFTGQVPLTDVDPDKVVALGAAIQAEALTKGSDVLLLDVSPLSLGIETMGGLVERIIERNTPIPAMASQKFTTYEDGQTGMKITVVQGEREMVNLCRALAEFEVTDIPPMPAGAAQVEVTFTLDADGVLTVNARETSTGAKREVQVRPSYGLSPEKLEQMLVESMEHAREDIMERLLRESRIEAQEMLRSLAGALDDDGDLLSSAEREAIDSRVVALEDLIKSDDRDAIDFAAQELDKHCAEFAERRVNRALNAYMRGKSVEDVSEAIEKLG